MFSNTYGDSFFDGPVPQAMKGPLIGGGLTQLGSIAVRKLMPSMASHAPLIGLLLGAGVSGFLMTKPQHKEAGAAGLATALLIGLPPLMDAYLGTTLLKGDESLSLGAYVPEMGAYVPEMGAYVPEMGSTPVELLSPVEIQDSGSGSTGVMGQIGALTPEMGATPDGVQIQGSDFGATGL